MLFSGQFELGRPIHTHLNSRLIAKTPLSCSNSTVSLSYTIEQSLVVVYRHTMCLVRAIVLATMQIWANYIAEIVNISMHVCDWHCSYESALFSLQQLRRPFTVYDSWLHSLDDLAYSAYISINKGYSRRQLIGLLFGRDDVIMLTCV